MNAIPEFVDNQELESEVSCNKDTGGKKTLQCRSRGMFFIVSAGGHIDYWQPLYRLVIETGCSGIALKSLTY